MFHRFFVPLDGSPRAEKAIPVAAALAHNCTGTVILARVVVPPLTEEYGANIISNEARLVQSREYSEARTYLDEVMQRYDQELAGLHLIVEVTSDVHAVSSTLLSLAEQEHTDMIVMCSRGNNWLKRWVFGSVAQSTMRHSPLPVLALNEHGTTSVLENPFHPLRVLIPFDGSPFSEAMLQPLYQLLALFPTDEPHQLHVLQVVALPPAFGNFRSGAHVTDLLQQEEQHKAENYLQEIAKRITEQVTGKTKVVVTTEAIVSPYVSETILKQTEVADYDLLALATHGRSGVKRALLGSVTEHIFGTTTLPLFVVCPPAIEAEHETGKQETQASQETPVEQGPVGLL